MMMTALLGAAAAGATTYRYYRWNIRGWGATTMIQAADFFLRNNGADLSWAGASCTNPSGSNPGGEGPAQLIDSNTGTKVLDFNANTNGFSRMVFDLGSAQAVNGYRWNTANDEPARDPITWDLQGSNDNSNWTTLHTVTGASITASRGASAGTWSF